MTATETPPVATNKTAKIELRAEPAFVEWVKVAAEQKGISVASYLRMIAMERMITDGIPKPTPQPPDRPRRKRAD